MAKSQENKRQNRLSRPEHTTRKGLEQSTRGMRRQSWKGGTSEKNGKKKRKEPVGIVW